MYCIEQHLSNILEIPRFKIFYETSCQYRINYTNRTPEYNYVLVDGLEDDSEFKATRFRHQPSAIFLQPGRYLRVNKNIYPAVDLRGNTRNTRVITNNPGNGQHQDQLCRSNSINFNIP